MSTKNLAQACDSFAKLAQQLNKAKPNKPQSVRQNPKKKVDPEKKKAIDLWANTLVSGYQGVATFLPSLAAAKKVFDAIAAYHKSSSYNDAASFRIIESLLTAITFSSEKLQSLGVNPADVLKQKGVENISAPILETLKANLEILRDAVDFSQYKDYYFSPIRKPGQVIELDTPEIEFDTTKATEPGY